MSDNRRAHARHPANHGTFCYIEGVRLDAHTANLSAGGAFLRTTESIPVGMVVVVVLEEEADSGRPTHLVGQVVREQLEPVRGVGVQWLRAVSSRGEEDLVRFLRDTLHVPIVAGAERLRRQGKHVQFDFEPTLVRASRLDAAARIAAPTPPVTARPPIAAGQPARERRVGPVTGVFQTDDHRMPMELPSRLEVGATVCQVVVSAAGRRGITVRSDVVPSDPSRAVVVVLTVSTTERTFDVRITARWEGGSVKTGFNLMVISVDDSQNPGIYDRWLKWLYTRQMASGL